MMKNILYVFIFCLLASCSSVLTDLASFKDPDFENRDAVKVMALIVNNATMQNINRVQFALKDVLTEKNIDVKFLDHYLINPPTRGLSENDLKKSLKTRWYADALLFINVISETGKVKGVDGDYVDADEGLKEKGKSDKYTTIAYGKYTASLLDVRTWKTIWKADLIAIDEKFKNTKAMYRLAAEKIVLDLLDKNLLSIITDKNKNNTTEYNKRVIDLNKSNELKIDVLQKNQEKDDDKKENKVSLQKTSGNKIEEIQKDNIKIDTNTNNKEDLEKPKTSYLQVTDVDSDSKLKTENNKKEKLNSVEIMPLNKIVDGVEKNSESVNNNKHDISVQPVNNDKNTLDQRNDLIQQKSIFR